MASWLLILVGAVVLAAAIAVVALVWVLSGRARPGHLINPHNDSGVQAEHAQAGRTDIHHNVGDMGPNI
ncbi:hypothetical protein ACFU7D_20660 [Nocardioides sp. NPDC057577]|uniref:hypothetical protein n=1 Tax=Nocardioides sp. NPDC057577 TaxID=3346171 RepID=UPI00366C27B3